MSAFKGANLWTRMGELEPWIDENFVRSVWYGLGENVNVKMIRDKFSGYLKPRVLGALERGTNPSQK